MRQTETTFTHYWRDVDALLADECETPATAGEIEHYTDRHGRNPLAASVAASIIRQRIAAARASVKAA